MMTLKDGSVLFFGMVSGIPPLIWDTHEVRHLPIPTILSNGAIANSTALIISLNQNCTAIILAFIQNESKLMSEDFVPEFKYIVKTCARLVASQDIALLPRDPRFSSDTGIVPPLHATASKCRNSAIRREAINQLSSSPRQDGMWDGVLSARAPASSLRGGWSETHRQDWSGYPSPPHPVEDTQLAGRISEVVDEVRREHEIYGTGPQRHAKLSTSNTRGSGNGISNAQGKGARETKRSKTTDQVNERVRLGRAVPDENRVQLTAVDFHIPTIKCHGAPAGKDGKREERETIMAW
ncbi:hypothetical protein JHW43_004170 [Diplocarpon mali]|nr:hypothetical protein JHW43_004170 [Diplocarpon mali]